MSQALRAFPQSEEVFRLLVGGVKDYAIHLLDVNGVVTTWNATESRSDF